MQSHESSLVPSLLFQLEHQVLLQFIIFINKWLKYSSENKVHPYNTIYNEEMTFWENLFLKKNYKHNILAASWSALSTNLPKKQRMNLDLGKTVAQMMKGIFRLCLPFLGTQWLMTRK